MTILRFALPTFIFFLNSYCSAQDAILYRVIQRTNQGIPAFIEFSETSDITHANFFDKLSHEFRFRAEDKLVPISEVTDYIGCTHYKYNQQYKGIPIVGAELIIHETHSRATSLNGKFIAGLNMSITPALSKDSAVSIAMKELNFGKYRWQDEKSESELKRQRQDATASYYPAPELVISSGNNSDYRLCWKFNMPGMSLDNVWTVFIDAITGKMIGRVSMTINDHDAPGSAETLYNLTRGITCNYLTANSVYGLEENQTRGPSHTQRIATGNAHNDSLPFEGGNAITGSYYVTSPNAVFYKDKPANSAHWGAEKTYDFYYQRFNRNSYDNQGAWLINLVHYRINHANAYWNGYYKLMIYGDGNIGIGGVIDTMVALDVVAHELSHAYTEGSSNLLKQGESGALNESFSDIMATCIEQAVLGSNFNWTNGENIFKAPPYYSRSLKNPKSAYYDANIDTRQPNTYWGEFWINPSDLGNDNGGIHYNSGVMNFWFYLLSMGGSGTIDDNGGTSYSVTGIGIDSAGAIAYNTNAYYLTSTSVYIDAMQQTIEAAKSLYGENSSKVQSVIDAWCAVGMNCNATGVYEIANNFSVSVYPNPSSGKFIISCSNLSLQTTLTIINSIGQTLKSVELKSSETNIDLSSFENGIYFLKINNESSHITKKLILHE